MGENRSGTSRGVDSIHAHSCKMLAGYSVDGDAMLDDDVKGSTKSPRSLNAAITIRFRHEKLIHPQLRLTQSANHHIPVYFLASTVTSFQLNNGENSIRESRPDPHPHQP